MRESLDGQLSGHPQPIRDDRRGPPAKLAGLIGRYTLYFVIASGKRLLKILRRGKQLDKHRTASIVSIFASAIRT